MRKGKGGTRDAFESPRVRPRAVTKACESGTPSILSDPVSCTFISSMTHGFVSVCQDQVVLVRREERGAEGPSFRLLRGVVFSVDVTRVSCARARENSGAPLLMVVTARSHLQLSEMFCNSPSSVARPHTSFEPKGKHLPESRSLFH